jgi:hypothetical protein
MPAMIETSLLVVQPFKDTDGFEWREGDRVPLHQRTVRRAALAHPEWFACDFETVDVDPDWLREIDTKYEAELDALKRRRKERKAAEERALREESNRRTRRISPTRSDGSSVPTRSRSENASSSSSGSPRSANSTGSSASSPSAAAAFNSIGRRD